jgi:hypothetical protein
MLSILLRWFHKVIGTQVTSTPLPSLPVDEPTTAQVPEPPAPPMVTTTTTSAPVPSTSKETRMKFTREQVEAAMKAKGYVWFEDAANKGFDVNIVGIRNSTTGTKVTNLFDDWLTVSYKENGQWKFHQWNATTDPGTKGVMQFGNAAGVARLVAGQYRGAHTIGLHQGKYEALRQHRNMKVYRDDNRDMTYDEKKIQEGIFGINIHRSSATGTSTFVENWSEGCQVFANVNDFNQFMDICRKSAAIHGNSFTYTLLESKDIV